VVLQLLLGVLEEVLHPGLKAPYTQHRRPPLRPQDVIQVGDQRTTFTRQRDPPLIHVRLRFRVGLPDLVVHHGVVDLRLRERFGGPAVRRQQ
jgi:hypothetical protein